MFLCAPRAEEYVYTGSLSCSVLSVSHTQLLGIMVPKHAYGLTRDPKGM